MRRVCRLAGSDFQTDGVMKLKEHSPEILNYICRGVRVGSEGGMLEAWMKSHKSEIAIS